MQANSYSVFPYISDDGSLVAFSSYASNLVNGDSNNDFDVFVRDWRKGVTYLVSVATGGGTGNGRSLVRGFSHDGMQVIFSSKANNLVDVDTNNEEDLFLRDLSTNTTKLISLDWSGSQTSHSYTIEYYPSPQAFSGDGRYFTFNTNANLSFIDDTYHDIYVYDRRLDRLLLYSVDVNGLIGSAGGYYEPAISAEGGEIFFIGHDALVPTAPGNGFYVASLANEPPYVYCRTVAASIPDNDASGVSSTINIPETVLSNEIALKLNISHAYLKDLKATLTQVGGAFSSTLFDRPNCTGADMDVRLWMQELGILLQDASCNIVAPALSGDYVPLESLVISPLFPVDVKGDWQLKVADLMQQDTGHVNEWCIMPLSHGDCDGTNVSYDNKSVSGYQVCNAGFFSSNGSTVDAGGNLNINFSGRVGLNRLTVKSGGILKINYHQEP